MAVVTNDAYHWSAVYHDGIEIREFDEPGTLGRGFGEVDGLRVREVHLNGTVYPLRHHSMIVPAGAFPVFFRRRSITVQVDGVARRNENVHCLGWRRDDRACYLFVFEDGTTLLTDNLQAV